MRPNLRRGIQMGIFRPISTIYYGLVLKIKFYWYSRKKRKKKKSVKNFLSEKLKDEEFDEDIVNIVIENYLNFGEIIFDRKILETAFNLNKILDFRKTKHKK